MAEKFSKRYFWIKMNKKYILSELLMGMTMKRMDLIEPILEQL